MEKAVTAIKEMLLLLFLISARYQRGAAYYITGVKEYTNCKSKSVIFDRSFGFSILNGSVSGFLPSDFDIKKLDVFGAAYYDKQWRGVRFYKY